MFSLETKKIIGIFFVCLVAILILLFLVLPQVAGVGVTMFGSECLIIKHSAFENGTPVCWRKPSPEFQRTINAEAYKLGYEVQPDGTYKNLEETLDYKNTKFEIGETKNNLPTPYKEGTPQE